VSAIAPPVSRRSLRQQRSAAPVESPGARGLPGEPGPDEGRALVALAFTARWASTADVSWSSGRDQDEAHPFRRWRPAHGLAVEGQSRRPAGARHLTRSEERREPAAQGMASTTT
jgi:hypothetical protein